MTERMVTCPDCGAEFDDSDQFCPECGKPRTATERALRRFSRLTGEDYELALAYAREHGLRPLTVEQRQSQLDAAIRILVTEGFQVAAKDERSATFNAPSNTSCLVLAMIGIFTAGIGLIIYLILQSKSPDAVMIEVDHYGEIKITGRVGNHARGQINLLN